MNVEDLRRITEQIATDRTFRQIVGRPLVKELRITNREVAALGEHFDKATNVLPFPSNPLLGVPIYHDPDVPLGTVVLVFEDGTTKSFRLT